MEYYLSDQNLKNDRFFYKSIKESEDRLIPLSVLQACRKIIALNPTEEELINAIQTSPLLEVDVEKKRFGRKNKFLPALREKKIYVTLNRKYEKSEKEVEHGENFIVFVPEILGLEANKKIFLKEKEFQKKLQKQLDIDVPFVKLSKKKGVVIFNEKSKDEAKIQSILDQGSFEVQGVTFQVQKFSEEQVKNWLDVFRQNLELGLKQKYNVAIKKEKTVDPNTKILYDEFFGPIQLEDLQFQDIKQLKNQLKLVVQKTKNGSTLTGASEHLVKAVLKFYPNQEKLENMDSILVDVHP